MNPGEIRVDHASRHFRVYPQPVRTLKEVVLARNGAKATDVRAVVDVSLSVAPGAVVVSTVVSVVVVSAARPPTVIAPARSSPATKTTPRPESFAVCGIAPYCQVCSPE